MASYGEHRLGSVDGEGAQTRALRFDGIDYEIDLTDASYAELRRVLKPYLKAHHAALGSINSPMQCMMKEICAQCLQPHKDPVTGKTSWVFSCFNQDQPLDRVDFPALNQRLRQNSVQEKLTARWISRCLARKSRLPAG